MAEKTKKYQSDPKKVNKAADEDVEAPKKSK